MHRWTVYCDGKLPFKRDLPVVPFALYALICAIVSSNRANGRHRRLDGRFFSRQLTTNA